MLRRTAFVRGLVVANWAACAVAWLLLALVEVESVLFTGPIIAGLSVLMIIWAVGTQYRGAIWLGLAHVGICVVFVALVNALNWGPSQAREPFAVMGFLYMVGMLPISIIVYRRPPPTRHPWVCVKCGYLLYGLAEARCPECGTEFVPPELPQKPD